MSRRVAREVALQALFQMDLNPMDDNVSDEAEETFAVDNAVQKNPKMKPEDLAYARHIVHGARENLASIDEKISTVSNGWSIERMPAADRNIARIAVYEMFYADEKLQPEIAINEAVELAKRFGTDKSRGFINGILDKMLDKAKDA